MAGKLREISVWDDGTGTGERFFCMTAEPGGSFEEELHSLMDRYRESGGDGGRRVPAALPCQRSCPAVGTAEPCGERASFLCFHRRTAPGKRFPRGVGGMASGRHAGKKQGGNGRRERYWWRGGSITACFWQAGARLPCAAATTRCGRNSAGWTVWPPRREELSRLWFTAPGFTAGTLTTTIGGWWKAAMRALTVTD